MMQLALPEGQKRKAEAEIRVYFYSNCQGAAPCSPGEKGRKGEGRIKHRKHSQEIANQGKMELEEEQQSPLF